MVYLKTNSILCSGYRQRFLGERMGQCQASAWLSLLLLPSFLPKSCARKITVKDGGCCSKSFGVALWLSIGLSNQRTVSPNMVVLTQADRHWSLCISQAWKPTHGTLRNKYPCVPMLWPLLFITLVRLDHPSALWEDVNACRRPLRSSLSWIFAPWLLSMLNPRT